jgi:hypothetical protein
MANAIHGPSAHPDMMKSFVGRCLARRVFGHSGAVPGRIGELGQNGVIARPHRRAAAAHKRVIQERLLHRKPKNQQAIYISLVEFQNFLRFKLENELLNALVGKVDIFLINLVTDVTPVSL